MNIRHQPGPQRLRHHASGYSLIVMIGVVAVVAIFAMALLRSLIREIDHRVARQETATLKTHKEALERTIMRNCYIPGPNDWANVVASEIGATGSRVATNPRRRARVLLVDTNGLFNVLPLPYTQTAAGITAPPKPMNARFMIISSLGEAPPNIGNYPPAAEFAALWNCAEGQIPATAAWSGWNGRPADIKIERIPIEPLLAELRLVTSKNETVYGQYSIGTDPNLYPAPVQLPVNPPRYLMRGTKVYLYTAASRGGLLDARQILNKNSFYWYEDGVWKSSAVGAELPGGLDLAAVVKGFLDATPNTNAFYGASAQSKVTQAMMDYMKGYAAWGEAGFPNNSMKTDLSAMQSDMMQKCQMLFMDGGNEPADNFPINNGPCE